MKKLFQSQQGFSLVQGMILAGILAGSGLVATRLIGDQKKVMKNAETRDQIEELHNLIYSALQNRENCEATIGGQNLGNALVGGMSPIIPEIRTKLSDSSAAFNTIVRRHGGNPANAYMNGNVTIPNMQIAYPTSELGIADLNIDYERLNKNEATRTKDGYGAKNIKKTIKLRIQRDVQIAGRPFKSCYALTTSKGSGSGETGNDITKQLCLEMNNNVQGDGQTAGLAMFVWDEANSTCIPNAKCPDHMIYTGFDSTGDVKCRLISEWANFGNMIQGTDGACVANANIRLEITQTNPVKFRIKCTPPPPP